MVIEDIVKSVRVMSTDEIHQRLREIRHSRSQQKEVSVKARPTKTAGKSAEDLTDALGKMSAEDKQMLLQLLGGK